MEMQERIIGWSVDDPEEEIRTTIEELFMDTLTNELSALATSKALTRIQRNLKATIKAGYKLVKSE